MFRILFALIGYVSSATLLAALCGLAYLWHGDYLNDEKTFRIVALLHDVDLQQLAEQHQKDEAEVPPEEFSIDDFERHRQVVDRNFEIKSLALERGLQEFHNLMSLLEEEASRLDRQVKEWEVRLKEESELASKQSIRTVVENLVDAPPETAKQELLRMMEEGKAKDVILLWREIPDNVRKKILKKYQSPEELDHLHDMHQLMLQGYPDKPGLDEALRELEAVNTDDS